MVAQLEDQHDHNACHTCSYQRPIVHQPHCANHTGKELNILARESRTASSVNTTMCPYVYHTFFDTFAKNQVVAHII